MFWAGLSPLSDRIREYLSSSPDLYKLALFQDEQSSLPERVKLCSELGIDCIYTCLESPHADQIYGGTGASRIVSHLPGYVSERMRELAGRLTRPDDQRPIDIGYRGRRPPQNWQGAAREKYEIAGEFKRRAAGRGLVLDIETDEVKRIYGKAWPEFVARCKAMLGTESGADIVGPDGESVPYRTTSPRHFESAALRTCQILFTGRYSGVLEAGTHYIPLAKDYSNVDEVLQTFSDPESRQLLTKQAFEDLIESDRFSYASFIGELDANLAPASLGERGGIDHRRVGAAMYGSTLRYGLRRVAHASRGHLRTAINRARGRPATDALRSSGLNLPKR